MPRRIARSLLAILIAAGVTMSAQGPVGGGAAQDPDSPTASDVPPVTFRVQVDYVEVDVRVTDANGNPVRDLRRDDFEVFEDKVAQKIELFTLFDIPVTRADRPLFLPTPIEPDVRTNEPFGGRLYVLLLDDLHTHVLRSQLVKRAARQFIERSMGANDLAAVVHLSGAADNGQDFTPNKKLLLSAVDKFMGRKLRSSALGRLDSYQRQQAIGLEASKLTDPDSFERGYNARRSMESLESVAKFLEGIRGRRKAVLYFSEGIDYDIDNPFDSRDAGIVMDRTRAAIGAAARANVAIYGIDPRGLTSLADETIEVAGGFPEDSAYGLRSTDVLTELRRSQDSLRVLAEGTGGTATVNVNDFASAFDRIVKDNSSYYVLGYYPSNDKRDGRTRKIDVRVKRPGVVVRSRSAYVAPRGKPSAPASTGFATGTSAHLRDALGSPILVSGLEMTVNAVAFKGEAPKASVLVTVQMDASRFKFDTRGGQAHEKVELSFVAIDAAGKIQGGNRQAVDLTLRPETRQAMEAAGFRMLSRLSIPPGRYQLRVGAQAAGADIVGAVHYDLEVPDFTKGAVAISGLLVSSNLAAVTPTAKADPQTLEILQTPPTTWRDFSVADTLWSFAEIYDNEGLIPHKMDIRTDLRAEDGRVVFKTEEQRASEELRGARGGFGHLAQIPLKDIAPGTYVLRVEAQSRLSDRPPVSRETLIRLWPLPPQAQTAAASAAPIVSVARGPGSEVNTFRTVVAHTDAEWQALWSVLALSRPPPKVTFENTMIVAVFLGARPSAGYAVDIVSARREGDVLVVEYVEQAPPPDSIQADVVTAPFAVVGVPQSATVRFDKLAAAPR